MREREACAPGELHRQLAPGCEQPCLAGSVVDEPVEVLEDGLELFLSIISLYSDGRNNLKVRQE